MARSRHFMSIDLSARVQLEVERSASEASKIVLKPVDVDRYLDPPADTPFPLEYAFHLLGDVRGKTVFDLGCGSGETIIPLVHRGAQVYGIDISPDLIEIANRRLCDAGLTATVQVGSAYETGLPDNSIDVVFCMSLIHHLDIALVREEMRRILRPGGYIVLKEPIRFSKGYGLLRSLLPSHEDISEYEHPLTQEEFKTFQEGFRVDGLRFFRLPFVPLVRRILPGRQRAAFRASRWILDTLPATARYATATAMRLHKPA
jgi:SAM-dependent methyltransferase